MDILYYFRQWPGSIAQNLMRIFNMFYWEMKRIICGTIYIAEFDLTDMCNLKCSHCYHFRENNKLDYTELNIDIWEKKFVELKKSGIRRVLLIGGEPALRMDIIKIACHIFRYVDICSNGTIRIDKNLNKCKLFISIDGNENTHDKLRGQGVFKKVLENYKNDNRVVFSMTITLENLMQIEEVILLAISNNVRGVSCDIYTPSPNAGKNDLFFVDTKTRKIITEKMFFLKKKYPSHFLMSKKAIKWYAETNQKGKPCYWRQAVKHFDANLNERVSCKDLDCGNCGHFAQANLSPLNTFLKK